MAVTAYEVAVRPASSSPVTRPRHAASVIVLDLFERVFVFSVYIYFASMMLSGFFVTYNIFTLFLLLSETLPIVFIVVRVPSPTLSHRPLDWALGLVGTILPLLVLPAPITPLIPLAAAFLLPILGLCLQASAKVVLGRKFGVVVANRGVVTAGPYRFLRHPMYAGYILTHIGFLLVMPSWRNAVLYALSLTVQIGRILREERVLNRDPSYRDFASRVRYRLVPGIF